MDGAVAFLNVVGLGTRAKTGTQIPHISDTQDSKKEMLYVFVDVGPLVEWTPVNCTAFTYRVYTTWAGHVART
jgi:hypothetical protein